MEAILIQGLKNIRKGTGWTKDKDVKESVERTVRELEELQGGEEAPESVEAFLEPVELALQSKTVKCKDAGLQTLIDLLSKQFLRGDDACTSYTEQSLLDHVLSVAFDGFDRSEEPLFASYLTLMQSCFDANNCKVSGDRIDRGVAVVFEIMHTSKLEPVQGQCKEVLLSMVDCLLTRLESDESSLKLPEKKKTKGRAVLRSKIKTVSLDQAISKNIKAEVDIPSLYPSVLDYFGVKFSLETLRKGSIGSGRELFSNSEDEAEEDEDLPLLESLPPLVHRDLFKLYVNLFKRTLKEAGEEPDTSGARDSFIVLDILSQVLDKQVDTIASYEAYIIAFQKYLLRSLLINCISQFTDVVLASMDVFTILLEKYYHLLGSEIDIFISRVFIPVLVSDNSPFEHKRKSLEVFSSIAGNEALLAEIFLNNDCDLEKSGVFVNFVKTNCHIASLEIKEENVKKTGGYTAAQYLELKECALDNLDTLLEAMANFPKTEAAPQEAKEDTPNESKDNDVIHNFSIKQELQADLSEAYKLFGEKPKRAIEFLVKKGRLEETPQAIAEFLYKQADSLNKTMIGDYMGSPDEFNLKVLHCYVDSIEFKGVEFSDAIRLFLSRFRLPGEAQKIDRMMEKFAESYTKCNPGSFGSADSAFVLGFSVIMLNTDLHNPNIAQDKKMTQEGFIRNCRGINDGGDFPRELLESIFFNIQKNPISLKEDEAKREQIDGNMKTAKKKKEAFHKRDLSQESRDILSSTQDILDGNSGNKLRIQFNTVSATRGHVRPMLNVVTHLLTATFIDFLQCDTSEESRRLCMKGLYNLVYLYGRLHFDADKNKLSTALEPFIHLDELDPQISLDVKFEVVHMLFDLAVQKGQYLGSIWNLVFQSLSCISKMSYYSTVRRDGTYFVPQDSSEKKKKGWFGQEEVNGTAEARRNIAQMVNEEFDIAVVDTVFLSSDQLDIEAIIDMISGLSLVSLAEIRDETLQHDLRIFLVQKILIVAEINMNKRSRIEWSRIWRLLSDYFDSLCCIEDPTITFFAIDSLKQLSSKFLSKEELSNFHFQKMFMKPLESTMRNSPDSSVRGLVLQVIENLLFSCIDNFESGWIIVFSCISISSTDTDTENVKSGFTLLLKIKRELPTKMQKYFTSFLDSLLLFCSCKHIETRNQAFRDLEDSCESILEKSMFTPSERESLSEYSTSSEHLAIVEPIVRSLSTLCTHTSTSVSKKAIKILFSFLKDDRLRFSPDLWSYLFSSHISGIFSPSSPLRNTAASKPSEVKNAEATTTVILNHIVELFSSHFVPFRPFSSNLLDLLRNNILSGDQPLSCASLKCLTKYILSVGRQLDPSEWSVVESLLSDLASFALPLELLDSKRKPAESKEVIPGTTPYAKEALGGQPRRKTIGDELGLLPTGSHVSTPYGPGIVAELKDNRTVVVNYEFGQGFLPMNLTIVGDLPAGPEVSDSTLPTPSAPEVTTTAATPNDAPVGEASAAKPPVASEDSSPAGPASVTSSKRAPKRRLKKAVKITLPFDAKLVVSKCVIDLEMIGSLGSLLKEFSALLPLATIDHLLGLLHDVQRVSQEFNNDIPLRKFLEERGLSTFMGLPKSPNLLQHETIVVNTLLDVTLHLMTSSDVPSDVKTRIAVPEYEQLLKSLFGNYHHKHLELGKYDEDDEELRAEIRAYSPTIAHQLSNMLQFPDDKFSTQSSWLRPFLVDLIQSGTQEVRDQLRPVFARIFAQSSA